MTFTVGYVYTVPLLVGNSLYEHPLCSYNCHDVSATKPIDIVRDTVLVHPGDTLLCLKVNSNQTSNHFHTQSGRIVLLLDYEFAYRIAELVKDSES